MKTAATVGLTRLTDADLRELLRAIHKSQLPFPLRRSDLMAMGMNRVADEASPLLGLDERAVRVAIALVMAERAKLAKA
ncbi:MAG: hypothetical protein AAF411_20550 [Myxococcota bacterium]